MAKIVKFPVANPALVEGLSAPVRHVDCWEKSDVELAVQAISAAHSCGQISDDEFWAEMVDVAHIVLRIQSTSSAR